MQRFNGSSSELMYERLFVCCLFVFRCFKGQVVSVMVLSLADVLDYDTRPPTWLRL